MTLKSASRLTGLSVSLLAVSLTAASAQDKGQTPPPAKEPPPTLEQRCTSAEKSSFQGSGKTLRYVFEVQNTCEQPLRCDLHIFIVNSFGTNGGHKVIRLAPKSQGTASRGSLVLKLKEAGGLTQHSHRCTMI